MYNFNPLTQISTCSVQSHYHILTAVQYYKYMCSKYVERLFSSGWQTFAPRWNGLSDDILEHFVPLKQNHSFPVSVDFT